MFLYLPSYLGFPPYNITTIFLFLYQQKGNRGESSKMGTLPFRVRIILRAVASAMVLWLSMVGFAKVGGEELRSASLELREIGLKDLDVGTKGKEKVVAFSSRPPVDVNYMNKRRVPRSPDPIHNRRAGDSRSPPGQA